MIPIIIILTLIACIIAWFFFQDPPLKSSTDTDDLRNYEIDKIKQEETNINAALDEIYGPENFWDKVN